MKFHHRPSLSFWPASLLLRFGCLRCSEATPCVVFSNSRIPVLAPPSFRSKIGIRVQEERKFRKKRKKKYRKRIPSRTRSCRPVLTDRERPVYQIETSHLEKSVLCFVTRGRPFKSWSSGQLHQPQSKLHLGSVDLRANEKATSEAPSSTCFSSNNRGLHDTHAASLVVIGMPRLCFPRSKPLLWSPRSRSRARPLPWYGSLQRSHTITRRSIRHAQRLLRRNVASQPPG